MRDFRDAKIMAQTLRNALKTKSVSLTHSESLELIAKVLGFHDWNTLSARIQSDGSAVVGATRPQQSHAASASAAIPVTPMRDVVFFPGMVTPIFVGREKTMRALESAMAGDGVVLVVTQRRAGDDDPTFDDLYPVGVIANVLNRQVLPDGTLKFFVSCVERKTIVRAVAGDFLAAEAAPFEETGGGTDEVAALSRAVLEAYQIYAKVDFAAMPRPTSTLFRLPTIGEPGTLADSLAPLLTADIATRQRILETADVVARLKLLLEVMEAGPRAA